LIKSQPIKEQFIFSVSSRFGRLSREFFWVVTGQVLAMSGSLMGVRLLTGLLPPRVYGELSLAITAAMLVNQVISGPIAQASLRFFAPAREGKQVHEFSKALWGLLFWSSMVIISLGVFFFVFLIITGHTRWIGLCVGAFGFALFWSYNIILDGVQNAARQRTIVAWHSAISTWSRFLAAAGMVFWLGVNSAVAMTGFVWASLLVLISQLWFYKKRLIRSQLNCIERVGAQQHWKSLMIGYAWPFSCWGLLTWAKIASDRWALQCFVSTEVVGMYTALYQIGYVPMLVLTGLIAQLAAPIFFQHAGDGSDRSRMLGIYNLNWQLSLSMLVPAVVITVAASAFHEVIFGLLVDPAYHSVSSMLPFMVLSSTLFATAQFALISLLSKTESRSLIAPKTLTAVLGILLSFSGAAWFGVAGVVGANVVFCTAYLIWILLLVRGRRKQFNKRNSICPLTESNC
jgi:O-antigen/teichoic acid export membrane protein